MSQRQYSLMNRAYHYFLGSKNACTVPVRKVSLKNIASTRRAVAKTLISSNCLVPSGWFAILLRQPIRARSVSVRPSVGELGWNSDRGTQPNPSPLCRRCGRMNGQRLGASFGVMRLLVLLVCLAQHLVNTYQCGEICQTVWEKERQHTLPQSIQ